MARISIDNGHSFVSIKKAMKEVRWDTIVSYMDDDVREDVHAELAPCTEEAFLKRYLELSDEDLIIG